MTEKASSRMFKVGLTRDLRNAEGNPTFGRGPLALLDSEPSIEWEFLPELVEEITPDLMASYDAIFVSRPRVPANAVSREDCRVRVIARNGVGFDGVDVRALEQAGVITTNTPIAIRRPVAVAALTFILALAGRLVAKDRITRTGRWAERSAMNGLGLTTRTVGVIGVGGIGREFLTLARPFGWRMLASDPFVDEASVAALAATKVTLETLLAESDFVVVLVPLSETTRHMINAERLALMKPTAYLINMARGALCDEPALIAALQSGGIAGAGLDVFEKEPIAPDNPLLQMDNVLVTPHSLCWTDECIDAMAREGLSSIVDVANGRTPKSVVRPS
jgi:D-3-phosphoglycerate dehydrogenase